MTPREELLHYFEQSFEDGWLSRGERKALRELVREQSPDLQELGVIRAQIFDLARAKTKEHSTLEVIQWLEEANKILLPSRQKGPSLRVYTSPGPECRDAIIAQLKAARTRIDICVFTISDNRLVEVIMERHRFGVKVRIITDNEKSLDKGSDIARMAQAGVPVRMDVSDHHMHHKFAIFDRYTLLSGSYNWTRSAAEYNWENLFFSDDPKAVRTLEAEFEKLWNTTEDY